MLCINYNFRVEDARFRSRLLRNYRAAWFTALAVCAYPVYYITTVFLILIGFIIWMLGEYSFRIKVVSIIFKIGKKL